MMAACSQCRKELEQIRQTKILLDLQRGGILCGNCSHLSASRISLSVGTVKQLMWVESGNLGKATRMKFSTSALKESTQFLDEFVCYHLGKQPRSLKFLRQIRT